MNSPVDKPAPRRQMAGSESSANVTKRPAHWPSTLLGKLTTADIRPWAMASETLLLPLIAIALGYLWNPDDPLWSTGAFPWSWLAPVILALRYGPLAGLGGAGVLLLGWLAFNLGHYDDFPQLFFLGGLILVMLVGEFSSLWQARTRRAETLQLYLDQRLEHLVRQYYLLRLSHDRLEQELIGRPMSMRDALSTLQEVGSDTKGPETLLRLLAQYCQLETAVLYAIEDDHLKVTPLASLGAPQALVQNDPLVQQAIESRKLCHISQALAAQQQSRYLVAAPLLDLGGELYGMLLIEEMPFFSLQAENLQTINLLLGYYTDGLSMQALAHPMLQALPDCPAQFAFEAQRLSHIRFTTGVSSIVVALEFLPRAIARGLPQQLQRLKRELDEDWLIVNSERQILAMLMPLGDSATAEGYIQRLETWSQQKGNQPLAAAGVFPHVMPLNADNPLALLQRINNLAHG